MRDMTFVLHFITPRGKLLQPSRERSASHENGGFVKLYQIIMCSDWQGVHVVLSSIHR